MARTEPRWVVAFLRALERTGEARAAAFDAGIDHTTAYSRRRAHGDFADRWQQALAAHEARVKAEEEAEIAALKKAAPGAHAWSPSPAIAGEERTIAGGKVRRVGKTRWGKEKERIFFEELAATSNLRMAADAAGVSTNAILARRHKSALFAAKFDAVVQGAKSVIGLYLVEETKKSFDPEEIDTGDVKPRVTIDQAIKISQMNAKKAKEEELLPDPFAEQAASMTDEDVDELRERIIRKLGRLRERDRREQLEQGWSYDESHDQMIPPGYVQGPDYRPKPPEEPINLDDLYK